jgi:lysophospholipase
MKPKKAGATDLLPLQEYLIDFPMTDNICDLNTKVFKYGFIHPCENVFIRYGIAQDREKSARAIVLLLHGRGEFMEKYEHVAKNIIHRNFIVISFDWRGQGLSCRELENRQKGHTENFENYINDLEYLYSEIIEPYKLPVYILAHSMGGHLALRFMSLSPMKIKKAVLTSPMIDIAMPGWFRPGAGIIAGILGNSSLFSGCYAIGSHDYTAEKNDFAANRVSHDPENCMILHNEIEKNPDLAIGGPTWGWVNAAFKSIRILGRGDVVKKITVPVLILTAGADNVVSVKAQADICRRLPECSRIVIENAFHELLFETSDITTRVWDAFDRFIISNA